MRNIHNRQKPHSRNPIARLLPRFKPAVTRNRTKYSRKGRAAQRLRRGAKGPTGRLHDTRVFDPSPTGLGLAVIDRLSEVSAPPGARGPLSARMTRRGRTKGRSRPPMRLCSRHPCAFRETDVKRAIRAVRAAGETPGRLVVTKDGFAVELLSAAGAADTAGNPHIRASAAAANTWDDLSSS